MDTHVGEYEASIRRELELIFERHRPSRHPFFQHLADPNLALMSHPRLLGELFHRYQAAMHATRAMVYALPMLDSPALRKRKLQILVDDDGLPGGDTHHYQLTRAVRGMGAQLRMDDESYDDLERLEAQVDERTAAFIAAARRLYVRSLGAWAIIEFLSDDWMHALAKGLAAHDPRVVTEPYFADCFDGRVEERHGHEAVDLLVLVCERRPERIEPTLRDAEEMAAQLTNLWTGFDDLLADVPRATP